MINKMIKIADRLDSMGLIDEASALDELINALSEGSKDVYLHGKISNSALYTGLRDKLESSLPVRVVLAKPLNKKSINIQFFDRDNGVEKVSVFSPKFSDGIQYSVTSSECNNYIDYIVDDIKDGLGIK